MSPRGVAEMPITYRRKSDAELPNRVVQAIASEEADAVDVTASSVATDILVQSIIENLGL